MYGLNMFALLLFMALHLLAGYLCRCPAIQKEKNLRILCLGLLLFNLLRYCLYPLMGQGVKIPVEFSTVAYFAVPAVLLIKRKKSFPWAAYSGLIAGFFYYATMIIAGGGIYNSYPPYDVYISLFCHGILYVCGMVLLRTYPCYSAGSFSFLGKIAVVVIRAQLLRPWAEGSQRVFLYELIDGAYVKQVLPERIWHTALPAYYVLMLCLLVLSIRVFLKLGKAQYQKQQMLQECEELSLRSA